VEPELRGRLLNSSPVTDIVGNRVHWGVRPQGEEFASVVLTIVAKDFPQHFNGNIDQAFSRVQIDCYGTARDQVVDLRRAVLWTLVPAAVVGGVTFFRSFVNTVRGMDAHTSTGIVFRDMIDMRVWHNDQGVELP
jgi:hypothetical protein